MSWLLRLYPPAWQRRFRGEVAEYLAMTRPPRFRTTLDLLAGAVDAWRNPEDIPAVAEATGGETMIRSARCASADIPKREAVRSASMMIGVTLVLTIIAVTLDKTLGDHFAIDALLYAAFFIALTVSSNNTLLRPYSRPARYLIMGAASVAWYGFFLAVIWLGTTI